MAAPISNLGDMNPGVLNDEVSQFNLKNQLAFIEDLICQKFPDKVIKDDTHSLDFKNQASHYSKPAGPVTPEDLKEIREERLYSPERLKDFAEEYWEKRRIKTENK